MQYLDLWNEILKTQIKCLMFYRSQVELIFLLTIYLFIYI